MNELFTRNKIVSRAINAENREGRAGEGGKAQSVLGASRKGSPCLKDIESGETAVLCDITGCGMIRHIWITVDDRTSNSDRYVLRDLVLRMYWDDEENPSVECPLGDFFALGFGETYSVYSSLITVLPSRGLNSYIAMPFKRRARITLENQHSTSIPAFFYQIDYTLGDELSDDTLYFHALWNRENPTTPKHDYTILDGVEGEGTYLGTTLYLSSLSRYWWGEGEVKFYIDDDTLYPTICGTGTEDYFGGSWSFAHHEEGKTIETCYNSNYMGYPFYSRDDRSIYNPYHNCECPPMRSFYRWHVKDPIFFKKRLRVTVQQIGVSFGGLFERSDDVSSVAYWYQTEPHNPFGKLAKKEERWPR